MHEAKFFIYARKSTDDADRQIRSIEDQLAEVRELAAKHSLNVVDVLLEKQSAKKPGRPVFNEMLERIEKGEASRHPRLAPRPTRPQHARRRPDHPPCRHRRHQGNEVSDRSTFSRHPRASSRSPCSSACPSTTSMTCRRTSGAASGTNSKNGIWPMVAPVGYLNDQKATNHRA